VIEPTDEMFSAIWRELTSGAQDAMGEREYRIREGITAVLALVERQCQEQYGDAFQAGWWRGQHKLCPRCGVALDREVHGDQPSPARKGYETAIAVLRDVAGRTGSPAAAWCADYLAADPDRLAPPPL
jgi:hypothetical protein